MPPLCLSRTQLSTLISLCGRRRQTRLGCSIHAAIVKNTHLFKLSDGHGDPRDSMFVWNSLIAMYSGCGLLSSAVQLFDEMPVRDTVSWNSVISACFRNDELEMGFAYFKDLRNSEAPGFDSATITMVLSAFAEPWLNRALEMIHSCIISIGFHGVVAVGNALITSFFKCKCPASAHKVFDEMLERNVITWTAMVSGFAQANLYEQSLNIFREMKRESEANPLTYSSSLSACSGLKAIWEGKQIHGLVLKLAFCSDSCVESALMDMYSKCGMADDACEIFQECEDPDEVSLTIMLACCSQNGMEERAFWLFSETVRSGAVVDSNMVSAVLSGFGSSSSAPLALGKQIHALIVKRQLGFNDFVGNSLMNMYSKCGSLIESVKCFEQMKHKNSVSWNSMIAAFARHGRAAEALQIYEDMRSEGVEPTGVTFLSLLNACSHSGSIEKGVELFRSMILVHGIDPGVEHLACLIDILGRAGMLSEAKKLIEDLPMDRHILLWQALLGASGIHGNLEMGTYAARRLVLAEPVANPSSYVSLANICSLEKRWTEKAKVIRSMKTAAMKKDPGVSRVEVGKEVHSFVVGDRFHPLIDDIHETLTGLAALAMDKNHLFDIQLPL